MKTPSFPYMLLCFSWKKAFTCFSFCSSALNSFASSHHLKETSLVLVPAMDGSFSAFFFFYLDFSAVFHTIDHFLFFWDYNLLLPQFLQYHTGFPMAISFLISFIVAFCPSLNYSKLHLLCTPHPLLWFLTHESLTILDVSPWVLLLTSLVPHLISHLIWFLLPPKYLMSLCIYALCLCRDLVQTTTPSPPPQ